MTVIDSRTVSLSEASEMLGMPEDRVLKLSQHGLIAQAAHRNGRTRLYLNSVEKHAHRSGITLKKPSPPSSRHFSSRTPEEVLQMLRITERQLHLMIQDGTLQASFEGGQYMINGKSLYKYVMEGE